MKYRMKPPVVQLSQLRRRPTEDGRTFRRRVFDYLSATYRAHIDAAVELVTQEILEFSSLQKIHALQLRRPLLERHSLPYLLTHQALFPDRPVNVRVLASCLAGHTLALTHLDYHLDGTEPDPSRLATAVKVSSPSATSYAIRMIYRAGAIAASSGHASRLCSEVFEPISGFVIARMHEDWVCRYDTRAVAQVAYDQLSEYLHSEGSRLLASGYWEVMARAAVISNDCETPQELVTYCRELRRLRQLADEAADLQEDLIAGLLTLPMMLRLMLPDGAQVREALIAAWQAPTDGASQHALQHVVKASQISPVGEQLAKYAEWLATSTYQAAARLTPEQPLLNVLIDLKRAKLETVLESYQVSVPSQASSSSGVSSSSSHLFLSAT